MNDILESSNFKLWKQEFHLFLKGKKLQKINKEQKKKKPLVDGTTDTYNQVSVTEDMLQEDVLVKEYINSKIYQPEMDASSSIFIANMESRFKELSILKSPLNKQKKIDYTYNRIPDNLGLRSNTINFQRTFDKFSELLIRINQRLINFTERKSKSNIKIIKIITKSPIKKKINGGISLNTEVKESDYLTDKTLVISLIPIVMLRDSDAKRISKLGVKIITEFQFNFNFNNSVI
ncbi:hypothetical protein H8356DRAFT_1356694 [Neocallimastix lanati (nom. inval.)]|nr:hypothetical protein H8356DRAFT_1356694 [Neocallimastix sp. JGI-2020a]